MPSNCLSAFSSSRESFCNFSAGGIVSVWACRDDTNCKLISSTVLPHHLQAVCTCFAWSPANSSSKGSVTNEVLVYGSTNGSVFIFNALSCTAIAFSENGHTGSVSSVAWHPNGSSLFSAADDGFLIEWNTKAKKLLKRWRCPNNDGRSQGGYTALVIFPGNEQKLVAARQQIDVWDLLTGRVTHTFVGHSSNILSLLPVVCHDKEKDEKSTFVLSLAKNDRVMYAWCLDGLTANANVEQSSPYAAFLLPDRAISAKACFHVESHAVYVFAVLSNGCVATYRHVLNGKKVLEPIRHTVLIEVTTSGVNKRLPVIDVVLFSGGDMMTMAYGDVSRPQFESFDMKPHWNEKHVKFQREILVPKASEGADGKPNATGKFHIAAAIPSSSMKTGSKRTLGETLKQQAAATREISASSVLAQGLLSRDSRILDSVLGGPNADHVARRNSENQKHIETALDNLDNGLLLALLDELTSRLATGHPAASQIAVRWLGVLLRFRGSRLASANSGNNANSAVANKLAYLRDTLIARTLDSSRVLQLRGRLRMLREMASPSDGNKGEGKSKAQELKSSTSQQSNTVAKADDSKPRLPFVLSAADLSGDEEESSDDSDSALEDSKAKGKKKQKKPTSSDEESAASSDVELASDDDLPDGERGDRLSEGSEDDEGEEDGPTVNGFNHHNSGDEMMDFEMDNDEVDIIKPGKTNGHVNGKSLKKKDRTVVEVPAAKKSKKLHA